MVDKAYLDSVGFECRHDVDGDDDGRVVAGNDSEVEFWLIFFV